MLHTGIVGISGTDYEPPVPDRTKTETELTAILSAKDASATDKALEAFTWEQEVCFSGMEISVPVWFSQTKF